MILTSKINSSYWFRKGKREIGTVISSILLGEERGSIKVVKRLVTFCQTCPPNWKYLMKYPVLSNTV